MSLRARVGGAVLAVAVGWNFTNVGAVAEPLADEYAVGLAVVGLFTTSLFLVHSLVQIPSGRTVDRFGAYPVAFGALALIVGANLLAMGTSDSVLAVAARALAGLGTGAGFVAGSDYLRASGGGAAAQGLFGGAAMSGGGLALALVPRLELSLGWRSTFSSGAALALLALVVLALAPRPAHGRLHDGADSGPRLLRDRRLYRLSVALMASSGLNAVVAVWVVTLLVRGGGLPIETAGAVGALTLAAGVVSRPAGGWFVRRRPDAARALVGWSLAAGASGTAVLTVAEPLPLMVVAAAIVGLAAGLPFAPVFEATARVRPDAPGTAIGVVSMFGNLVVVVGTPLLGLAFALPGDGRIGFALVALLWASALLVLPSAGELGEVERPRPAVTECPAR